MAQVQDNKRSAKGRGIRYPTQDDKRIYTSLGILEARRMIRRFPNLNTLGLGRVEQVSARQNLHLQKISHMGYLEHSLENVW